MSGPALALSLALLFPLAAAAAAAPRAFPSIEEFAGAVGLRKGGWTTTVKVTSVDVEPSPLMDPATVAELKAGIAKAGPDENFCLGESPRMTILPGMLLGRECSFSRIEAGDGRWALSSSCKSGPDNSAVIASEGSYTADRTTGRHSLDIAIGGARILVTSETVSRFVGECRPPAPPVSVTVTRPKKN